MTLTAAEQYGIELLNRARLDPLAEAARYGLALNDNLSAGTISSGVKQVLAANDHLDGASTGHSAWMIDTATFSHTGADGSDPGQRMAKAGYSFSGGWSWGENLAYASLTGGRTASNVISLHHEHLMHSAGHRANIMADSFREVGYAQDIGTYNGLPASMVTENFAHTDARLFVTGVAYADHDDNRFYTIGEGQSGVTFAQSGGVADTTQSAGGYQLLATRSAAVQVTVTTATFTAAVSLDLTQGNVKLDLVDQAVLFTSANMVLIAGLDHARLIGAGALRLTGNAAVNALAGNRGDNRLDGQANDDRLYGNAGRDTLLGGSGDDLLKGGADADRIWGYTGHDTITGGTGNDHIGGGSGADTIAGDSGRDTFVFKAGYDADRIMDFSIAGGDRLALDDQLWTGTRTDAQIISAFADITGDDVVFTFGNGDRLTLDGIGTLSGLAAVMDQF